MKFLMVSKCGEGAQLLYNIGCEGNDVRIYIQEKEYRRNWKGIIPQSKYPAAENDEVVLFDMSGMGRIADSLRSQGIPVFGGSKFADKLEHDREFGLQMMQKSNIKVPDTHNFDVGEWSEARNFIKRAGDDRYVFKPSGDNLPSKLTYCPSDNEDLLEYLEFVEKYYGSHIREFVLQQFIEGTIISTEFWCDGTKFIRPANHTVEVKKFMNDDLGPSTGCSGNLIWIAEDNPVVKQGITRLEKLCVKENYCGPIDLNAIVNDEGVWGLEWTPRFGYDSMPTILQFISGELGQLFSDLARGQMSSDMPFLDGYAAGVRLTIPPYPIEPESIEESEKASPNFGLPLRGLKEVYQENCYLFEIAPNEEGTGLVHGDGTGVVLVASDLTDDPKTCLDVPYKILEECKIPDKQYRTDLKKVLPKMYEEARKYATN
jgi:phosphoribosylamine--glycine ligase